LKEKKRDRTVSYRGCRPAISEFHRRKTVLSCFLAALVLVAGTTAFAQPATTEPTSTSAPSAEGLIPREHAADPAYGWRLLESVHDGVYSFDDPAFYWFCRYVKDYADAATFTIAAGESPVPWKFLMERPSDYRGQLVVVEGTLLSRPPFEVSGLGREGIGRLYECELGQGGTKAICSVICIENPESIPIRSSVRAKGYFIKYRTFTLQTPGQRTTPGEVGAGPLIVARRLELAPVAATPADWSVWRPGGSSWLIIVIAAMAVAWLFLRRAARRPLSSASSRHPPSAGETTLLEGDFAWLTDDREVQGEEDNGERSDTAEPRT
jgi:hypothetical protein